MTDSEKLDIILSKLDKLENDVTDMKLTLENEIRTNIQHIAEGHLDLSKIDHEKEMLAIRVNVLETEVRRLKDRIEQIA